MLPSGFHLQNCINIIGNGCVVNLPELVDEIKKNESRGVSNWKERLFISDRAHLGRRKLVFIKNLFREFFFSF